MQKQNNIISDLQRFRCMSRNDIANIHFRDTRQPVQQANIMLKRLRLQGDVVADTSRRPYIYFPADSRIKKQSQKIDHYLAIVQVYQQLCKQGALKRFDVEPKYGSKGTVEPDIFCIYRGSPFFIEVQRSIYADKYMTQKLKRYEQFKREGKWRRFDWQPQEPIFPHIWIIGDKDYDTSAIGKIKVLQSRNVGGLRDII